MLIRVPVFLLIFSLLFACEPPSKPSVFVSLPLIKTTLEPIVKDYVEIIPILDSSINPFQPPSEFDLSPEILRRSYQMILFGDETDSWVADLVRRRRGALQLLTTVDTPGYVPGGPGCIWLHPGDARFWVDNLLTALEAVDKKHAPEFVQNALPIKDELNTFYHSLRWYRLPKRIKTFVPYSSCSYHLLNAVGVHMLDSLTRSPSEIPNEENWSPILVESIQNTQDNGILLFLSVDHPEGVKKVLARFPHLQPLRLKTFPHEIGPSATLIELLSYNVDQLLAADR